MVEDCGEEEEVSAKPREEKASQEGEGGESSAVGFRVEVGEEEEKEDGGGVRSMPNSEKEGCWEWLLVIEEERMISDWERGRVEEGGVCWPSVEGLLNGLYIGSCSLKGVVCCGVCCCCCISFDSTPSPSLMTEDSTIDG